MRASRRTAFEFPDIRSFLPTSYPCSGTLFLTLSSSIVSNESQTRSTPNPSQTWSQRPPSAPPSTRHIFPWSPLRLDVSAPTFAYGLPPPAMHLPPHSVVVPAAHLPSTRCRAARFARLMRPAFIPAMHLPSSRGLLRPVPLRCTFPLVPAFLWLPLDDARPIMLRSSTHALRLCPMMSPNRAASSPSYAPASFS